MLRHLHRFIAAAWPSGHAPCLHRTSSSRKRSRSVGRAALAFLCLALLGATAASWAGDFKPCSKSAERALAKAYQTRKNGKSCEPVAPIETRLSAPKTGTLGSAIDVRFEAMVMEAAAPAEYQVDVPAGVRLVGGKRTDSGIMQPLVGVAWDFSIVVDRPGNYEVHVQLIAGHDSYRYGQRRTLTIRTVGNRLEIATEKPRVNPVPLSGPLPAPNVDKNFVPSVRKVGPPPPVDPFTETFDPFGNPIDNWPGITPDALTTVTGTWRYRHTDGTLHAGYGSYVEAWDDDTVGADDFLARDTVDGVGNYSLTFDNGDDAGFGTADVYLVFRSQNSRIVVHNAGTVNGYSTATGVLWSNIGAGTFQAANYFADWGTNGVSDSNERAFQATDDGTTAWQHWRYYSNILFDNRLTYIQWYVGSTDGSYYLTAENRIYFEDSDVSSVDVLMHEYGHSMHDGLFSDSQWPPGTGGPHGFTGHYTTGLAWTEGFGTYYSCTAQGNDWIYNSYDPGNLLTFDCDDNWDGNGPANGNADGLSTGASTGYDTESAVLSFLLDIDDGRNSTTDPYDWMTAGDDEVFNVMRNYTTSGHRPYSVQEFFDGWHSIVNFQNPKINGLMHNHGMPQPAQYLMVGVSSGVSGWSGTWYYGGYGRGSFDVKNYSSRTHNFNRLYVWLRGPGGEDIGQFGSDFNNDPIPSGDTRNIWMTADQTGYNPGNPNFVYGNYTITAGHYRTDNVYQNLEASESGATNQITKNVVEDPDGPDFCTVQDDGECSGTTTTLHFVANAVDSESSIKSYWTRVGTSPGSGNEQDWVEHLANNQETFDYTITGLSLAPNTVYYITVVARNIEGHDTFGYSDGIVGPDATPPGPVTVTDDGNWTTNLGQLHFVATSSEPDGCIKSYWTRVGTGPGLGNAQDWVEHVTGDVESFEHTLTGLSLTPGQLYYITVVARNMSNIDTFGVSDGIRAVAQPRVLTVNSQNPNSGVNVTVTNDLDGLGVGTTSFTRTYDSGAAVTVAAPAQVGSKLFDHLEVDGAAHVGPLTMDADHTVTAVYVNGHNLSIQSTNPNSGVAIKVWTADYFGNTDGTTTFVRTYKQGTNASLTAPAAAGPNWFSHWVVDGATIPGGARTLTVNMNTTHTARAVYATGRTLTINSTNPDSGVPITVWKVDRQGLGNGTTAFVRQYAQGDSVPITAPQTVGTSYLLRWDLNGAPWVSAGTVSVPMWMDHVVTAVYGTGMTVTVTASEAAVPITAWIRDRAGLGNGDTDFTRLYAPNTNTSFTAPPTANGKAFLRWELDGVVVPGSARTIKVLTDAPHTIRAVYEP